MSFIKSGLTAALLVALSISSASAIGTKTVFTEAEAANGDASLTFLDTVVVSGSTAYATFRDTSATDLGAVTAFDGSSFTTVMTPAQYTALGSTNDYAASAGAGVVGNKLRTVSFFDNNVTEVDLGTGMITEVVSKATIDAAAGGSVNLSVAFEVGSDGTIYSADFVTDQLIAISPSNTVSVEIGAADYASLLGTSVGGVGILGDTLLLGSNTNDELVSWDTVNNLGATVLTTAEIEAVTDDIDGRVGFGDILAAPNGLVYFYESDSDYLLSFDPSNPVGTLTAVVTEAEFGAGPGSDLIAQLAFYDGRISWTDQSDGFFQIVPEPASLSLVLLSLLGLAAARRR